MRILFLITKADTIAGIQIHVRDLALKLQHNTHKVLIVTGKKGIYNQLLQQNSIDSIACKTLIPQINPLKDWQSFQFILQGVKVFQPDLIAIHSRKTGILGRVISKITGIPCTLTAHSWSFSNGVAEPNRTIYQGLETLTAPLVNKIICVSEFDRNLAIKAGINSNRLITIRNGIKDIPPSLRAEPSADNPVKILMVAHLDRPKDRRSLIRAFQHLSNAELIFVGDGKSLQNTQSLVAEFNLSDKVQFLGFRQDIAEIMSQAHIYALISRCESLSYTIIEAMRAGLPVVASDVGGVNELVEDETTGYLIPREDRTLLSQKLAHLVDNPQLRAKMGNAGRQKHETKFTFERMYATTLAIYQEILSQ